MRVRGFSHENICAMNRDPFDTQAIEHEREVAEAKRKQRLERFSVQLKEAMASKEGREMIFTILDFCQLQVCSFNTNALAMLESASAPDTFIILYIIFAKNCTTLCIMPKW